MVDKFIIGRWYRYGSMRGYSVGDPSIDSAFQVLPDIKTKSGMRASSSNVALCKMILNDVSCGADQYAASWYREVHSDGSELGSIPVQTKPIQLVDAVVKSKRRPVRQLFLAANKNGMTHKALVNQINKRGVKHLGLSPLQSLSRYEDENGVKIPLNDAVVFKLVPYSVRIDKKTGKPRLDREIGYSKEN